MISTAAVGMIISIIFVISGFNLGLVILIHGFIDTAALIMMHRDWDRQLRNLIWRS